MTNQELINELEIMYRYHQKTGNIKEAQEMLLKIADMKATVHESEHKAKENILLG